MTHVPRSCGLSATAEVWIVEPKRGNRSPFRQRMQGLGCTISSERFSRAATAVEAAYRGRLLVDLRT